MNHRRWSAGLLLTRMVTMPLPDTCPAEDGPGPRPNVAVRGVYGGVPAQLPEGNQTLADQGVNAVWLGSGGLTHEVVALLRGQGAKVFAEFNSVHDAAYLKDHPDADKVGLPVHAYHSFRP
jgi:hypothetical protein